MVIHQGDVIWADFRIPAGSAPGFRRPAIVVQSDRFNDSALSTLVVVVITSNLRREMMSGNVRLAKGEANLQKPSVVNVTQVMTIDRSQVLRKLGEVGRTRLKEVMDGIALVLGADRLGS